MEVHIVQKGETLWKIARHFGISFEELKRVNGHLANPDYVVPGMKIFLPGKSASTETGMDKKTSKDPNVVKKTEKEPVKVAPPTPVEQKKEPVQSKPKPAPTPEMPKAPVVPEASPKPMPTPTPMPMPQIPPIHPMTPMQPMHQQMPFIGVPCGWMPIYDADCFPFVQPGHMQQAMPMPTPQLPVKPESSMHMNVKPIPKPMPLPEEHTMPDGWKLLESPELQFQEGHNLDKLPNIHFEESSSIKAQKHMYEQVEDIPMPIPTQPQFEMPYAQEAPMQGGWQIGQPGQQGHPGNPGNPGGYAPYPPAGCGCGQSQGQGHPYPQMSPCGSCGQYHPMPQPVQQSNHCNACNQPIQAMPRQMMPFQQQNNNWPGSY